MEKDTKRVWHLPYCFLEPGELEREFARLAAQGWLLEKCTYGTYTYLGYSATPTYTITSPTEPYKFFRVTANADEALPTQPPVKGMLQLNK